MLVYLRHDVQLVALQPAQLSEPATLRLAPAPVATRPQNDDIRRQSWLPPQEGQVSGSIAWRDRSSSNSFAHSSHLYS